MMGGGMMSGGSMMGGRGMMGGGGMMGSHYAHGGWTHGSFYYYPQLGFGQTGLYSWHYGSPFPTAYPYNYYYGNAHTGPLPLTRIVGYHGIFDTNVSGSQYYPFPGNDPASASAARANAWVSGYQQGARDERVPLSAAEATVRLRIEPKEAALFLDGNPIGSAEHFSRHRADLRLPPGKYFLEAAFNGYTVLGEVLNVKAGQTVDIARQLAKSDALVPNLNATTDSAHPGTPTRPTGVLLLSGSPPDARVLLDGRFLCYANMVGDNRFLHRIPAGPHTIEVSREGYRSFREEIVISPLRPVERKIVLERG
jgi:hypothetical protein